MVLLHLEYNYLNGTIPSDILSMTWLADATFSSNQFVGSLPQNGWQALTDLESIFFSMNTLTGEIPLELVTPVNITEIGLDNNLLKGDISLFANLPNLKLLYVDDNLITGTLSNEWFDSLKSINQIYLGTNRIQSSLPSSSIFAHPTLELLDLHSNLIIGSIPDVAAENKVLQLLALHNNSLTGPLPTTISSLSALRYLDVSHNHLVSTIPTEIGKMTSLGYLFLAFNRFDNGTIPSEMQNLNNLTDLSLQSTQRYGTIPAFLGSLANLTLLDLSDNELTGEIPDSLNDLTLLDFLLLNRNQLHGNLSGISQLTNVGKLLMTQ